MTRSPKRNEAEEVIRPADKKSLGGRGRKLSRGCCQPQGICRDVYPHYIDGPKTSADTPVPSSCRQLAEQFMIGLGAAAAIVNLALTPLLIAALRRLAVLDLPNERSSHSVPTPRGAGLSLVVTVVACMGVGTVGGGIQASELSVALLICGCLCGAVGLCDDIATLSARSRLIAQVMVATAVTLFLVNGSGVASVSGIPVAAVCILSIVAYINAFNFMDGINGISGLHGVLGAAYYGWQAWRIDDLALAALALAVAGASLSFLPFNFPRARIFLGDVGSYFLGAMLASLGVSLWLGSVGLLAATAPLLVYITDTGWTLVKRARARKPLTEGHREHAYQRLALRFGHARSATFAAGCSLAIVAVATSFPMVHPAQYLVTALILAVYIAASEFSPRPTISSTWP